MLIFSLTAQGHITVNLAAKLCIKLLIKCVFCLAGAGSSNYTAAEGWSSDLITRCLMVSSRAPIAQEQIYSLFDLIPGMEYCEMQRDQYGFSKGSIDQPDYNSLVN